MLTSTCNSCLAVKFIFFLNVYLGILDSYSQMNDCQVFLYTICDEEKTQLKTLLLSSVESV